MKTIFPNPEASCIHMECRTYVHSPAYLYGSRFRILRLAGYPVGVPEIS